MDEKMKSLGASGAGGATYSQQQHVSSDSKITRSASSNKASSNRIEKENQDEQPHDLILKINKMRQKL
jgi:hypothetical protein